MKISNPGVATTTILSGVRILAHRTVGLLVLVGSLAVTAWAQRPAITNQLVSQTVNTGQTAVTFSATATRTPALTHVWHKGGAAIAGATNATCTIVSAQSGDAGSYDVVASNSGAVVAFAVCPSLPEGMSLNVSTGIAHQRCRPHRTALP